MVINKEWKEKAESMKLPEIAVKAYLKGIEDYQASLINELNITIKNIKPIIKNDSTKKETNKESS
tara:strand:- start:9139 stop:9333 length:195 start_codon:yes stop_codon:yes gene_type:complete